MARTSGQLQKKRGNPKIAEAGKATRFIPGQSGNPKGPPLAKVQLWNYVRIFLDMTPEQIKTIRETGRVKMPSESKVKTLTAAQVVALRLVEKMMAGDLRTIKEAMDRDEGPFERNEVESDALDTAPVPVQIILKGSDGSILSPPHLREIDSA